VCRLTSDVLVHKSTHLAATILIVSEHQAELYHLSDVIAKSLASAGATVFKEPSGVSIVLTENAQVG